MKRVIVGLGLISALLIGDGLKNAMEMVGTSTYMKYKGVIEKLISPNDSLKVVAQKLKQNGLLKLTFSSPRNIYPVFVFKDRSPLFDTFTLYTTLRRIGYSYFFPYYVKRENGSYSLQLQIKAGHQIDPVSFMEEMEKRGCKTLRVKKYQNFLFVLNCANQFIPEAIVPTPQGVKGTLQQGNGSIWIKVKGGEKLKLSTLSQNDKWHPHILFFSDKLELYNNLQVPIVQHSYTLTVPDGVAYLRVDDLYTTTNLKNGLLIKLIGGGGENLGTNQ
ncbi:MAG: hypothetical protein C6I01_02330 [Epsilonproteobacteria bacterium]|nr:hypothetical protein [Campylobacterota bacterium]NPA89692.1 hypothetical protein [Campylobacterota bacterium]